MSEGDLWKELRDVRSNLERHLGECAAHNAAVENSLRSINRIVWFGTTTLFIGMATVIAKNVLHWI